MRAPTVRGSGDEARSALSRVCRGDDAKERTRHLSADVLRLDTAATVTPPLSPVLRVAGKVAYAYERPNPGNSLENLCPPSEARCAF